VTNSTAYRVTEFKVCKAIANGVPLHEDPRATIGMEWVSRGADRKGIMKWIVQDGCSGKRLAGPFITCSQAISALIKIEIARKIKGV
jgi:hypothetical protein